MDRIRGDHPRIRNSADGELGWGMGGIWLSMAQLIPRRRFMSDLWRAFNVGVFAGIAGILGSLGVTAFSSRHPATLACYECRACLRDCPLRWDLVQFLIAARTNNPEIYMMADLDLDEWESITGRALDHQQLVSMDPNMIVQLDGAELRIAEAPPRKPDRILKLKVKHAAQLCPLCMLCTKNCPIAIEITQVIVDLKLGGMFGILRE